MTSPDFIITVIPAEQAPDPGEIRVCTVCHRPQPAANFHGDDKHRRRVCRRCVADDLARKRRRSGAPVRHDKRFNVRGDCWCNRCKRYRPVEDFKAHPSRPGKLWSYCKPCTREIDRERYAKRTSTFEGALREIEKKNTRKRRLMHRRMAERRKFLIDSILLLRRRGLTKAEIVRLTDTTFGNLLKWERGEMQRPTKAVCDRFAVVVRATTGFPIGEPAFRRRLPHPAMAELLAVCLPQVERIPVRSSWKNGNRQ